MQGSSGAGRLTSPPPVGPPPPAPSTPPASPAAGPPPPISNAFSKGFGDLLLKVLAAAFATLGLAGFVAVLGGAVVWVRLHSAQMPADQAVAAIPKNQLIVTGAAPLVFFLLLGLLAVLGVYLAEPRGTASTRSASAIVVLVAVEMTYAVLTGGFRAIGVLAVIAVLALDAFVAIRLLHRWRHACRTRDALRDRGKVAAEHDAFAQAQRREHVAKLRLGALVVATAAFGLLLWWLVPWLGYTLLLASAFGVIVLAIAYCTDSFLPYGAAVFVSVALFGAAMEALRTIDGTPRVQPAAALVKGNPQGVSGLYVGETSDRLYLAHVDPCQDRERTGVRGWLTGLLESDRPWHARKGSGVLFWIDRSTVTALNIGPVQNLHDAMWARKRMRYSLLADVTGRAQPLPPQSSRTHPRC